MWPLPPLIPQTDVIGPHDMQDSMDAIEQQLQAVEDALFDTEESSKEHNKLRARYERLKENKTTLLKLQGRPLGSCAGGAHHLLDKKCTADSRPVGDLTATPA